MDYLYSDAHDFSKAEYADLLYRKGPVSFGAEMGAYVGEGMDWMPIVRAGEYLGTHGDYQWMAESSFEKEEIELAEKHEALKDKELSKEEYTSSVGEREELKDKYAPGITQLETDSLIQHFDQRRHREFVFQHAPEGGWRKATGMGLMFAVNATDPTNYIPVFGWGTEVNALGRFFGLNKLVGAAPGWGAVVVNAADAAVGTALADVYLINRLHSEGENTQWSELWWDVIMSAGAGSALTAFSVGVGKARGWVHRQVSSPDTLFLLDLHKNIDGMDHQIRMLEEDIKHAESDTRRVELTKERDLIIKERDFAVENIDTHRLDMELKNKHGITKTDIEQTQARLKEQIDEDILEDVKIGDEIPEATVDDLNASMREEVQVAEQEKKNKTVDDAWEASKQVEEIAVDEKVVMTEIDKAEEIRQMRQDVIDSVMREC